MTAPMPKDNEVDEKVMPVAWIVTNGGESCEPWLEYEESEVDALPAVCIAEPLYSAATVAELRAEVIKERERADKFMWQVRDTCARAEAAERRVANALALADSWQALADKFAALGGDIAMAEAASMTTDARQLRATLTGADPT